MHECQVIPLERSVTQRTKQAADFGSLRDALFLAVKLALHLLSTELMLSIRNQKGLSSPPRHCLSGVGAGASGIRPGSLVFCGPSLLSATTYAVVMKPHQVNHNGVSKWFGDVLRDGTKG